MIAFDHEVVRRSPKSPMKWALRKAKNKTNEARIFQEALERILMPVVRMAVMRSSSQVLLEKSA